MEYRSLFNGTRNQFGITVEQIRDIYPTGEENVNDAFAVPDPPMIPLNTAYTSGGENVIQFRGKYEQNFINFRIRPLTDINVDTETRFKGRPLDFRFIVNFAEPDGTPDYWTSPIFMNDLMQARAENNPYFTFDRVPVVIVPYRTLQEYSKKYEFTVKEGYAEVEITETIDDKREMLLHIQWLVSAKEAGEANIRPVKGLPPDVAPFGAWSINTTPDLGMGFAEPLRRLEVGNDLDGFDASAANFPIPNFDPDSIIPNFTFDNDRISRLNDPRSNQDYDGGRYGEDYDYGESGARTDSPIVDVREENRSNQDGVDYDTTRTGEGDTGTRTSWTTDITTTGTTGTTTGPLDVRSSSGYQGTYYPFSTAGVYVGETRTYSRKIYVWDGYNWLAT